MMPVEPTMQKKDALFMMSKRGESVYSILIRMLEYIGAIQSATSRQRIIR